MVAVAVGGVAVLGEAGCGEWCPSPCPHADPLPHPLLWLPPTPSRVPFPASYPALLLSVWMWEGSPLPFPRPCLFLHLYVCVPNLAPFCFLLLAPHTDHCTLLFAHCVCPRLCLEAMAGGGPGPMCCRAALFFPWAVCGSAPCCTVLYTSAWPPPHCLLTSFPFFSSTQHLQSWPPCHWGLSSVGVASPPPPPVSCPLSPLSCPPCCCGLGL